MVTIEQIKEEIEGFEVIEKFGIIEVEFDDYIIEIDKTDMEGVEINKDTLAKVIFEKYQDE